MRVKRIGWAGTRTSEYTAMVAFLQGVLGLSTSQEGSDFAAFQLPEGGTFEVFGPADQDHEHFSTGPVVGFVVDDLTGAVRELEAAKSDPSWLVLSPRTVWRKATMAVYSLVLVPAHPMRLTRILASPRGCRCRSAPRTSRCRSFGAERASHRLGGRPGPATVWRAG